MNTSMDDLKQAADDLRITLTPQEENRLAQQIENIFHKAQFLRDYNFNRADAACCPHQKQATLRADELIPSLPRDKVMLNSPDDEESAYFHVPRIIE